MDQIGLARLGLWRKLHVVAVVWFPIAAVLIPANVADSDPAPELLNEVPVLVGCSACTACAPVGSP